MPARKSAAPAKKSETKIVRRRVKKEEVAAAAPAPAEPAPVVEAAANEPAAEEESVVSRFTATIDALQNTLTEMRSAQTNQLKDLEKELKTLKREQTKVLTKATKRKTRRANPNSGVHKPVPVSAELCAFLKQPADTLMSRTEVNRAIHVYIKEHNLQDPSNGRKINPDRALRNLLKVPTTEDLTYFTMGRQVKNLFPKATTTA